MKEEKTGFSECEKTISIHNLLDQISIEIVPILAKTASDALKTNASAGLELAEILVADAIRYEKACPRARGGCDENILSCIENLRNRNGI